LEFDVASVKENKSNAEPASNFPLNSDFYVENGGLLSATNWPLVSYIFFAYKLQGNQGLSLVRQLPSWVITERFDIQARAAGNPTKDQMRLMMRSLLADRFMFAVHAETREVPVLAFQLVRPGQPGPQLRPHPAGSPCPTTLVPSASNDRSDAFKTPDGLPRVCNTILGMPASVPGRSRLAGRDVTVGFMADLFNQRVDLGRPMIDATGLPGTFDFVLEFKPDTLLGAAPGTNPLPDPDGPTFEQALRDQLGLKMESRKTSMEVLVLDHVEHLSEN